MFKYSPTTVKNAVSVVPSDSTVLSNCDALYVGVAGDLVVTINGAERTFKNAAAGYHPLSVTQVKTATAATDILALTL